MAKLDMKRKIVIVAAIVGAILLLILGRSSKSTDVAASVQTPAVAVEVAEVAKPVEVEKPVEAPKPAEMAEAVEAEPVVAKEEKIVESPQQVTPEEKSEDKVEEYQPADVPDPMGRAQEPVMPAPVPVATAYKAKYASDPAEPFQNFIVYQDKPSMNHYVPSGFMPTAECMKLDDVWVEDCQEGRSCIKITYDTACGAWSGLYWLDPANNWGDDKGGYNLTGAKKLTFWAKGENGGEVITEVKIGGVGVNRNYTDTDTIGIGPITLTKEWQAFSIDLMGRDLSRIIGGFAMVAHAKDNTGVVNFYIDNIHYE